MKSPFLIKTGKIFGRVLLVFTALLLLYSLFIIVKYRPRARSAADRYLKSAAMRLTTEDMTARQKEILLKVEDPGFYSHKGVDLKTPGAGLTTITQGLVKIMFFDHFRPGFAKLKQTLIARFALDPFVSKQEQLILFVNLVYLGHGVRGFADAAEHYFNKAFKNLTEDEYISLVAMIIAPRTFNVKDNPASNRERSQRIKLLVAGKYRPKNLMDQYYGTLTEEERKHVAPVSYFP